LDEDERRRGGERGRRQGKSEEEMVKEDE
jgi:hypothetical protein